MELDGQDICHVAAHELVTRGIGHAPEGRRIFSRLTVYENLLMGGFTRSKAENDEQVAHVYELFPRLQERARRRRAARCPAASSRCWPSGGRS